MIASGLAAKSALPSPRDAPNEVPRGEGGDGHSGAKGTGRPTTTRHGNEVRDLAWLLPPNGANAGQRRQMGGSIPGSPLDFAVHMKKRGRQFVANRDLATNTLCVMIALLVGKEVGEEIRGDGGLGRVAGKLDDGNGRRRRKDRVGSSDGITEN